MQSETSGKRVRENDRTDRNIKYFRHVMIILCIVVTLDGASVTALK